MKDLEHQGYMMVETSSRTTRSYVFKTDSLSANVEQMENINVDGETRIALGEGKQ